jgi:hypothetical protein
MKPERKHHDTYHEDTDAWNHALLCPFRNNHDFMSSAVIRSAQFLETQQFQDPMKLTAMARLYVQQICYIQPTTLSCKDDSETQIGYLFSNIDNRVVLP